MIEITKGNLLEANAEALVNTVNCVGFMGWKCRSLRISFRKRESPSVSNTKRATMAPTLPI